MVDELKQFSEWQHLTVDNMLGGLVLDGESELLENNDFLKAKSVIVRDRKLSRDTGYVQYQNNIRGNPRRVIGYKKLDGSFVELLITDETVYYSASNQWQYASNGTATTISANEAGGQTVLSVTSITGFADNDFVGIVLDTGQMHFSQVNGAPGGGTITIDDALPSQASTGNAVVKASTLAGLLNRHVTAIVLPWNNWVVFTNGVNNLKRFDPVGNSVVDCPGLTNVVCQTLALYDNSVLIANLDEAGTLRPYRIKYCAKGDATNWTTLESGSIDLLDQASNIQQLLNLGPYLVAYRTGSIARMEISASSVKRFNTNTMVASAGVFTNLAAVDLIDRHLVWGNENFFWYRGGNSIEEINNPIREHIYGLNGELSKGDKREAFAIYLKPVKEILFFPSVNATVTPEAIRYHINYDKWTKRAFNARVCGYGEKTQTSDQTWNSLTGSWETLPAWVDMNSTGENYKMFLGDSGQDATHLYDFQAITDGAVAITFELQTKDFAHPVWLSKHDFVDVGASGGPITVDYSPDKGNTWINLGTINGTGVIDRYRLFKQFVSRTFRYRFTSTSACQIAYINTTFKYEYPW